MRRMYSEQELTNVIKAVFEQELEDGALDENVADAVDAYLVEHPVDITALEGQDISCNSVDADGTITGAEIVEKMSGYSFTKTNSNSEFTLNYVYAGIVKNGNKLTCVIACEFTRLDTISSAVQIGQFGIPTAIGNKLFPSNIGGYDILDIRDTLASKDGINTSGLPTRTYKSGGNAISPLIPATHLNNLSLNDKYFCRYEITFLLSDNLISE